MKTLALSCVTLMALATGAPAAAAPQKAPTQDELTTTGRRLEADYAGQLEALRSRIRADLPRIPERRRNEYLEARAAEKAAEAALKAAQEALGKVAAAQALVDHAKGKWIGGADQGIAKARELLARATTQAERDAAEAELARWQVNRQEGLAALAERQAALDAALREQPELTRAVAAAEAALAASRTRVTKALDDLGLTSFLTSSRLDAQLAKFVVLFEATPRGLALFAQRGKSEEQLVERLLGDDDLLLQMAVADGASGGAYGRAMEIYTQIQTASPRAGQGALQRLALAIALEHAVPVVQRNPATETTAPATVDPVARYRHYEKAFLDGELDPAFGVHSVWDYRMVVDGDEPDETLAWGREMLRSYRPDHVYTSDTRWRYVEAVRTEIRYGSQDNQYDRPDLQFYQNILMNGGVCGRRAFFGRFMLRAFGVPTTARPQRGHAALVHWTPDGWVVCLGAGWGSGWTKTRYDRDLDFLATTQARADEAAYLQVKRAQWIGDVEGEKRVFGLLSGNPGFWYGVALHRQRAIVEATGATPLAAVGEELAEANESRVQYAVEAATVTAVDREIAVSEDGVITIPAVACSTPTKSTGKILFLPSNLGGKQLHYNRNGGAQDFEYTFDAPAAGRYHLTARVATPSWQQHLLIAVNGAATPVDLALPHTVGLWGVTDPVEIQLVAGRNVLHFSHRSDGYEKGFSLRDITLTPAHRQD
ncbi:MAG: hypothetical protein IPM29_00580 [Planctomycetes bacterium]|nr:hypothetical protein [Planctomycetota bacterium]